MVAFADTPGARLARGVRRFFADRGEAAICEFSPAPGLRVDLVALAPDGAVTVVECKSCLADFRADAKWAGYLPWCDRFFFAVAGDFPLEALPDGEGVLLADAFGAELLRPSPERRLAAARRRALTLRIARAAADRLARLEDPAEAAFSARAS